MIALLRAYVRRLFNATTIGYPFGHVMLPSELLSMTLYATGGSGLRDFSGQTSTLPI